MRPDFDNPNYWKSLYTRPADSNTQGVVAGSTEVEDGDLEAELDPYAVQVEESTNIDQQAVMSIVEEMVEKRLQALMAQGWGPNGGGAPKTPSPAPAPSVAPPPPPPPPRAVPPQQAAAPFQDPPPQRQQAAAPFQDAPPERRPTPPPQRRPTPPPAAKPAKPGVGAAMWGRVPTMPGGQASLFKAGDLGQEAIQLLVMVDGSTSLRGLRQLVPHLDDQAFLGIIRAAIKKGILDIS